MSLSLVPPEEVEELVTFRPTVSDGTRLPGQVDTGRISQCGTEATLCCGSRVRIHQVQTGCLCSELRLGRRERLLAGPFVHFGHADRAFLAVAVRGEPRELSLICIFHPSSGRVIRAIRLATPATHLAILSGDLLARLTGGWLALATEDRRVLLLGLCLDSSLHHSDESSPLGVVAVEGLFSNDAPDPAHHGGPAHPCVHICDVKSLLELENLRASVNEDAKVTCLEWLPQLACLGIGLSCGTVHIWDVETLTSAFTVLLASDLPVVALAVQEPENDPRCCSYLWVAQGATSAPSAATLSCCSVATMHSVSYERKEPGQDGRCVYRGFKHSQQMFEYPLEPPVVAGADSGRQPALYSGELGSRVVSFQTVPPPLWPRRGERTEDDPGVLLLLSWQLVQGCRVVGSYLSVFDMNQWYRAHMPQLVWLNDQQLCPYMGVFSLREAVAKCGDLPLLDVWVAPSSVKKYRSPDPLVQQAHFPSSLAFSCVCLTAEGTVRASFLGMQRQLLHDINVEGSKCLNDATNLCTLLFRAGLIEASIGLPALQQSPAAARGKVLDVALEHRMVGFLVACLQGCTREAASSRSTLLGIRGHSAGEPLLPFVLNWTWAKVIEVKAFLDELYVPLFNCSGQDVTKVAEHMSIHLHNLSILHRLLEHALGMDTDDPGLVEVRCNVVDLLEIHLRALLFLLHSKVLPDNHISTGLISYPYATLRDCCLQARKDLGGKLLVDALVEVALAGTEEAAATPFMDGEYPPSSIQQATDIYLRRDLKPWAPHALTYYLLLDISSVIVRDHPAVQENMKHFPEAFSMGADLQALVQGIWSLDHCIYKEGLEQMQRAHSLAAPRLRPVLCALWGPAVRMLLRRGEARLAMCGLGRLPAPSTAEELALQLDVLLANSNVVEALELVRRHGEFTGMDQLLGSLVTTAKKNGLEQAQKQLDILLRVPLSATEEECLTGFFCELGDPVWLSQAALYFLQCGRPHTALPLTTTIREIFREGRAQQQQQPYPEGVRRKAAATLELMQSFMRIVPSPASKKATATVGRRNAFDSPLKRLGTGSTRGPHGSTALRMASRGATVRATADAAEAPVQLPGSRAVVLPRASNRPTTEQPHSTRSPFHGQRRHSLQRRLEAEALSILRTPPVQPWQRPPAVGEFNVGGPASYSTPSSTVKRCSMVGVPRMTSTPAPMGCPPTPPAASPILPAAGASIRKLTFATSGPSLLEIGAAPGKSTLNVGSPRKDSVSEAPPLTSTPDKDAAADIEEDLDGTPLVGEQDDGDLDGTPLWDDDDLKANCGDELRSPLAETDACEGALPVPAQQKEGTAHSAAETEFVILLKAKGPTVTPPTSLCCDPCSPLVELVPNRSPKKLVMSGPVPEFAACEESAAGREAGSAEEVKEISTSEAAPAGNVRAGPTTMSWSCQPQKKGATVTAKKSSSSSSSEDEVPETSGPRC